MDFVVIIPARYASTRLPGKPLADIAGKPMVVRVAERARDSGARQVWVATDHPEIAAAAERHGFAAVITGKEHPSGTDRIAEVAARERLPDDTIVVNVQGDEPFIDPQLIREVAQHLERNPRADMATACHAIEDRDTFTNPNVVKVVLDRQGLALYFSRAPVPYPRDAFAKAEPVLPAGLPAYRHIGIYAYRAGFLRAYARMAAVPLESFEALEQLRALWHGHRIAVCVTRHAPSAGIDTREDLERARRLVDRGAT